MTEIKQVAGGPPVPSPTLVQADQDTILGDGSHSRPLHAGPAGNLGSTVVVFRPGGVAGENVAVTWDRVLEMLGRLQGTRVLEFDDSRQSPIVIPTPPLPGERYPMADVVWSGGAVGSRAPVVQVGEGVAFSGLRRLDQRVHVVWTGTSPAASDLDGSGFLQDLVVLDHGARVVGNGGGPFFRASVPGGAGVAIQILGGAALVAGAAAVVDLAAAGVSVAVTVEDAQSDLQSSTLSGVAGSTLTLVTGSSGVAQVSEDQPGFAGTLVLQNATKLRRFPTGVITSSQVLSQTSQLVEVDPTSGPITLTLPPASRHDGESITVKNVSTSTNLVTLLPSGADLVDGAASATLSAARFVAQVTSDRASAWWLT